MSKEKAGFVMVSNVDEVEAEGIKRANGIYRKWLIGKESEADCYMRRFTMKKNDLVHGNAVAIGDAGFTANPLTGGGIGPSIRAANLPADVLRDGGDLEGFQRRYMDEVANGYERNYYLSRALLKLQGLVPERVARWAFEKFYEGEPVEE